MSFWLSCFNILSERTGKGSHNVLGWESNSVAEHLPGLHKALGSVCVCWVWGLNHVQSLINLFLAKTKTKNKTVKIL
jgi:hypothetical protein